MLLHMPAALLSAHLQIPMKTGPRSPTWRREGGSKTGSLRYVAALFPRSYTNGRDSETTARNSREDSKTWSAVLARPLLLPNSHIPSWRPRQQRKSRTNSLRAWPDSLPDQVTRARSHEHHRRSYLWMILHRSSTLLPLAIFRPVPRQDIHSPATLPQPPTSSTRAICPQSTTIRPTSTGDTRTLWT